jgi:hypothetical protein
VVFLPEGGGCLDKFYFTFEADWRHAPLAHWVHADSAPAPVPHRGYVWLHVPCGSIDMQFSSGAQLAHCIDVLARKPLPTSRQLSALRGSGAGPNGHWLSRLPGALKAPARRARLIKLLRAAQQFAEQHAPGAAFAAAAPPICWTPTAG